jgi:hypothetical protein
LILSRAPNARGKIDLFFLAELPYLVVPFALQRIQYSAMIVDNSKAEKLMTNKFNLERNLIWLYDPLWHVSYTLSIS